MGVSHDPRVRRPGSPKSVQEGMLPVIKGESQDNYTVFSTGSSH